MQIELNAKFVELIFQHQSLGLNSKLKNNAHRYSKLRASVAGQDNFKPYVSRNSAFFTMFLQIVMGLFWGSVTIIVVVVDYKRSTLRHFCMKDVNLHFYCLLETSLSNILFSMIATRDLRWYAKKEFTVVASAKSTRASASVKATFWRAWASDSRKSKMHKMTARSLPFCSTSTLLSITEYSS